MASVPRALSTHPMSWVKDGQCPMAFCCSGVGVRPISSKAVCSPNSLVMQKNREWTSNPDEGDSCGSGGSVGSGVASGPESSLMSPTAGATSGVADSTVLVLAVSSADDSTTDSPGLPPQDVTSSTMIRNVEYRLIPGFSQNQDVNAPCWRHAARTRDHPGVYTTTTLRKGRGGLSSPL